MAPTSAVHSTGWDLIHGDLTHDDDDASMTMMIMTMMMIVQHSVRSVVVVDLLIR